MAFIGVLSLCAGLAQERGGIEFETPAAALEALRQDPNATVSTQEGWTIVSVESSTELSLWSFTPEAHPAHPAAVKRTVYEQDGAILVGMDVLCGATKPACDALVEEFEAINRQLRESIGAGAAR